jgi:predicted MFS family arabinose efflux permease
VLAALYVLTVIMAQGLGLQARQFGYLLAAAGVGLAINAAFITYVLGRRYSDTQLSLWGTLGMALSLVGVSFATNNLWMALGTICFLGAFAALVGVPMQTRLLAETPIEMRGKIFGLENNAVNIALTLPLALTGPAEQKFGLPAVLIIFAILTAIGGVLCWYVDRRESVKSSKVDK